MAEQAELIQQQMDETRTNLADKLEKLGTQITGTVEKVSDVVEETVEAVSDTVETVAETTQETVHAVKEAFNLPKHIQQNPWLWFGGSLALGFLGGRLFLGGSSRREHDHDHDHGRGHVDLKMPSSFDTTPPRPDGTDSSAGWDASALEGAAQTGSQGQGDTGRHEDSSHEESESWLGTLAEKFGPQIDMLKQLAVGSLFGVARDMVAQALPESMKLDVSKVIDEMTQNAGGKPIQGSLIEKSDEHKEDESTEEEGQKDEEGKEGQAGNRNRRDTGNQSSSDRWDRPHERQKQTTERQGQPAGQSKKRR